MANENNNNTKPNTPPRGPMGGGRGAKMSNPGEKPKDFKIATSRLIKELNRYRILMIISLILAVASAIISTMAPDKLSNLANSISEGLMVNTKNIDIIKENMSKFPALEEYKIDGTTITVDDQIQMMNTMSTMSENSTSQDLYKKVDELPESVKTVIEPKMDMNKVKNIAIGLFIMYFASAMFMFIQSLAMTDISNKFARDLRQKISKKINTLPLSYFDRHATGDILSRVTNDVDTISQSLNQSYLV